MVYLQEEKSRKKIGLVKRVNLGETRPHFSGSFSFSYKFLVLAARSAVVKLIFKKTN